MKPRIGLVGVPVETVPIIVDDTPLYYTSAYFPSITDHTRDQIVRRGRQKALPIEDLGEVVLGEYHQPRFDVENARLRVNGLPYMFENKIRPIDMKGLEQARENISRLCSQFDLLVAVGHSHLGAVTLYQEQDCTARLDYHADFSDDDSGNTSWNYANYMNWVKKNIKPLEVLNYFVKYPLSGKVFGKRNSVEADSMYSRAHHFDIDVDCFNSCYQIQDAYHYVNGEAEATPDTVVSMIGEAKPEKIGVWEFRPKGDKQGRGLEFVVEAIAAASKSPLD